LPNYKSQLLLPVVAQLDVVAEFAHEGVHPQAGVVLETEPEVVGLVALAVLVVAVGCVQEAAVGLAELRRD